MLQNIVIVWSSSNATPYSSQSIVMPALPAALPQFLSHMLNQNLWSANILTAVKDRGTPGAYNLSEGRV
jgi:hypothetical protein